MVSFAESASSMNTDLKTKQFFLFGVIGICLLIVGGLVWAIIAGPRSPDDDRKEAEGIFRDDADPSLGPHKSKAAVHIYGDFQCPACAVAEEGLSYARKTHKDTVRFVWKDFPLISIHTNALPAANAARCAESQGKFWEYHDKLYEKQRAWYSLSTPVNVFIDYAQDMGLQLEEFKTCLTERRFEQKIKNNLAEGRKNNVQATPTFFIGNKRVTGVLQNSEWDREIQRLLQ